MFCQSLHFISFLWIQFMDFYPKHLPGTGDSLPLVDWRWACGEGGGRRTVVLFIHFCIRWTELWLQDESHQLLRQSLKPFPKSIHTYRSLTGFQRKKRLNRLSSSVVVTVFGERRALHRLNLPVGLNKNWHLLNEVFGWTLRDNNLLTFLPMCSIDALRAHFWLQLLALSKGAGILSSFWLQGVERWDSKLMKGDFFPSLFFVGHTPELISRILTQNESMKVFLEAHWELFLIGLKSFLSGRNLTYISFI